MKDGRFGLTSSSDNGTELTGMALLCWSRETPLYRGGQAAAECLHRNGRLRDELLNETLFASLSHVREALAIWKDDYNTVRPHCALGNLRPAVFAKLSAPAMQRDGTLRYIEGSAPRCSEADLWTAGGWSLPASSRWRAGYAIVVQ